MNTLMKFATKAEAEAFIKNIRIEHLCEPFRLHAYTDNKGLVTREEWVIRMQEGNYLSEEEGGRRQKAMEQFKDMFDRAMGILVIDEGVIIRAYPETENRTEIELAPSVMVGAIVRNPKTGRWQYDDAMRMALGITKNPDFATDLEAGKRLLDFLPPLPQINAMVRRGSHKGTA